MIAKLGLILSALLSLWIWWRGRGATARLEQREARAILGVTARADAAEIRAAHRRLLSLVHPDRGGSPDWARRVNAARDTLLRSRP